MQEQTKLPGALFGFKKEAVLSYIYEMDASAKNTQQLLEDENERLRSELDGCRKELSGKASELEGCRAELEEVSSQYSIVKAQLYNAKETAENLNSKYTQLRADAERLASAARSKDNELKMQIELNKKLQERVDARHGAEQNRSGAYPAASGAAAQTSGIGDIRERIARLTGVGTSQPGAVRQERAEAPAQDTEAQKAVYTAAQRHTEAEAGAESSAAGASASRTGSELSELKRELAGFRAALAKKLEEFEDAISDFSRQSGAAESKEGKDQLSGESKGSRFFQ